MPVHGEGPVIRQHGGVAIPTTGSNSPQPLPRRDRLAMLFWTCFERVATPGTVIVVLVALLPLALAMMLAGGDPGSARVQTEQPLGTSPGAGVTSTTRESTTTTATTSTSTTLPTTTTAIPPTTVVAPPTTRRPTPQPTTPPTQPPTTTAPPDTTTTTAPPDTTTTTAPETTTTTIP